MKRAGLIMLVVASILMSGALAAGTESFDVPVYPGGSYDKQTSKAVSDMTKVDAACYRTNDSVSKVVEFYKKQAGLALIHADGDGAMFRKGKTDITVQTKWMDMKTGKMNNDTLISIVKNK